GTGGPGFSGDGGPATQATLLRPASVTVDDGGNLVIADTRHSRVRVVAATSGTFYGRAVPAANISTAAPNGLFPSPDHPAPRPPRGRRLRFPPGARRRRGGQPAPRRYRQFANPRGGGQYRNVLRAGDDRRGHLPRRWRGQDPGRRRPSQAGGPRTPVRGHRGP